MVKIVFLLAFLYVLYFQINSLNVSFSNFDIPTFSFFKSTLYFFLLLLTLSVNYFLETQKWRLLSSNIEGRNFPSALSDILIGLFLGLFSPFMIGDYAGRAMSFKEGNKKKMIMLNGFNSVCQTYVALFFGFTAFIAWKYLIQDFYNPNLDFVVLALGLSLFFGIIFIIKTNISYFSKYKYLRKFVGVYDLTENSIRYKVLLLSLLRNITYLFQYILIFNLFGIELSFFQVFVGVNLILLIKTIGGGLNVIGDLTLRQIVGIYFFTKFGIQIELLILSTFIVWFINVFLPALAGYFEFIKKTNTYAHN